jgi:ParB family chromosome partitioning protein
MKRLSQDGKLDMDTIFDIMTEEKPNQKETVKIQREKLDKYFGRNVSIPQIEATILRLLENERIRQLKKRSEREDR